MRRLALLIFVLLFLFTPKAEAQWVDSLDVTRTFVTVGETFYTDYYTSYSVYTNRSFFKDENGGLHMVMISNYKLIYNFSSDSGNTWLTEELSTELDGTFKMAVIYADADGNPYIAATVNPHYNYGNPTNVDSNEEFRFNAHFFYKEAGEWITENVYMSPSSNYGMEVSELYMNENGDLVLIGNRFGWYTNGGAIYQHTRSEGVWSDLNIIYEFNEAGFNHFTFLSYSVLNSNGMRDIIFSRHSYNIEAKELLSIHFDGENWGEPNTITTELQTYRTWSMTTDNSGGSWLVYFNNDPTPQVDLLIDLEPTAIDLDLSLVDTIQAMVIHYTDNGELDLLVYPLNSDTAVLYVSEDNGVTWGEPYYADRTYLGGILPTRDQLSDQTTDLEFMQISRVSQEEPFGPDSLFYSYIELSDTNTVGIADYERIVDNLSLHPNPFTDMVTLNYSLAKSSKLKVRVFTLQGKMIVDKVYQSNVGENQIHMNLGHLETGTYILEVYELDQGKSNSHRSSMKLIKMNGM